MEYDIYFCNDGILRAKYTDKSPMIPLKFIQKELEQSDLTFWVRWWENNVYFEKGLTLGKFLICLEPWTKFWSEITLKNIGAYIAEVRKPYDISKNKEKPLSWIGISYYTEIDPDVEFKKDDDDLLDRDFGAWLNSPKESKLTGDWNIHSSYRVSGFIDGEEEQYSIDFTPMNELANLPIFLNNKQLLYVSDWRMKKFFDNKDPLFAENPFGVVSLERNGHEVRFFEGEKYHKMRDVIEGFFWWMYAEPSTRDDFSEDLKDALNEIKDTKEIDENIKEKESSVESSEDKKMEVRIAPGAFDSLIAKSEREKDFWQDLLSVATKNNDVVLKIGLTAKAEPPESRYFGYIQKEKKDLSTIFKLF